MKRWPAVVALVVIAAGPCSFARGALAGATAPVVVLLSHATPDEMTTEATARVNGELKAAGFDVAVVPLASDDAKRELESAGRERNAIAAFAIFVRPSEGGTSVAEIWVSDRTRQKVVIQNALLHETDRGRGSEILAVRAVELLRASLADFWTPSPTSPPAPPVRPSAPAATSPEAAERARSPFASGVGAGLGAAADASFGAMGATWSPDATASYGWPGGFSVRATFAGLGPTVTLSGPRGYAGVAQQLAFIEAVKTWWPRAALVPFVTAGAGAEHVHVAGVGNPPYEGHTSDDGSLLTAVGVGLAVPLVSTLSFVVQARALAEWPPSVVQVAGTEVGRVGGPSLRAGGGLFGTLP